MLKDVAFGQYYPVDSFVHRMDPRAKIILVIAYIVLTFLVKNFYGFLAVGIFLLCIVFLSKVPLNAVLRSIRGIIFLAVFASILNILFYDGGTAVTLFGIELRITKNIAITVEGLISAAFLCLRLVFLVLGTCLLTLTTSPVELTSGIESLLKPLNAVRFPVRELALIMSIALRFIPTLMEETDRIIKAQKSRGADFESGSLIKRVKALIPILIPLLISSFRRAEDLGDAMDARCYSCSEKPTKYKKLSFGLRDLFGIITFALIITGIVFLNIYLGGIV